MRPIKLSMQAFGPYANKVIIDFDKLGNNGIYLITGDTGAGKSTIFDGITYALFDKTSLEERDPSSLRSKYAEQNTNTEVELTFVYDNKEYTIKRTPQYEYITRNGTPGKKESTVELTLPGGKVYTGKKKETDKKISEIIGLEYEQFKRIVMIAQGDFKQLLLDKKGRGEIFRKIFDTSSYVDLQTLLKEERKNLKDECKNGDEAIRQSIDEFYYDEDDDLSIELEEIQSNSSYNVEAINDLAGRINSNDEKEEKSIKEKLNKLDKELAEVNKAVGALDKVNKIKEALATAKENKNQAATAAKTAKTELDKIQKQKPEIEKKRKEYAVLEKELTQYKDLDKRYEELEKLEETQEECIEVQEELKDDISDNKKNLTSDKKEYESLKDISNEYQKAESALNEQLKIQEQLEDFDEQLEEYVDSKEAASSLEKKYLVISKQAIEAANKYTEANKLFLDNQAGVLAKTLANKKPCPVCGSLEHPNCAKLIEKAPSEVELKKIKKLSDDAQNEQKKTSNELSKLNGEVESLRKSLIKISKKLLETDDLDKAPKLLKEKTKLSEKNINELENSLTKLEQKQKRKQQLEKTIQKQEQDLNKLQDKLSKIDKEVSSNEASIKSQNKEIGKLAKNLSYDCLDDAKDALNELTKCIKNYETTSQVVEKQYKEANEKVVKYEGSIVGYEEQLKGNVVKADNSLKLKKEKLDNEKDELTEIKEEISKRFNNNTRTLNQINRAYKQIESSQKKLEWVSVLCDTANGTLNGKDKVTFETFIQMSYFDRILAFGNNRLEIMTNGQYSFVRGDEGLELNVIDHYNGTTREVSTLSGGESFMASLSLALGMSDEVQSRAASIEIDTLFVDEGFGSLDGDTLNKALDALHELSQGNRLVGIISHVNELKNRIDKKIIVTKDKANGSEIKYEI